MKYPICGNYSKLPCLLFALKLSSSEEAEIVEIINAMGPGKVHLGPGKEGKYSLAKYGPISAPFDTSRLNELGFKPRPTKEALNDYAAWIRTEMKEGRTC